MKPVIIGAGLAGLTAALSLAPMPIILVCANTFSGDNSSSWAQGGIAAALAEDDSAALHAEDTIKAGAGLCDPEIVRQVTAGGPKLIEKLVQWGAQFDRDAQGALQLGLEGAHGKRRIVHAGDATGAAIMQAMTQAVRSTSSIEVLDQTSVLDIAVRDGRVSGVTVLRSGEAQFIATDKVVLATGGVGALWQHTTNPLGARGQGIALAARAGAVLGDLEFMQFHPTGIVMGRDPMPLASEALRGEGAVLVDEEGQQFTDSLKPRDIVARAIWQHRSEGHRTFLDVRPVKNFAGRFPHIYALCVEAGIDAPAAPIEIHPAAHYHMGGVITDARGRTSVTSLWACGEVANTGLNGANRLASNSLLEAAYFGEKVAEDIMGARGRGSGVGEQKPVSASLHNDKNISHIRSLMSRCVGVLRDEKGLAEAVAQLAPLAHNSDAAMIGLMIAQSALQRRESIGAHARTDYPQASALPQRSRLSLVDIKPLLKNNRAA